MLIAHHLAHLGGGLAYALNVQGLALDLSEFDTETAQFHLGVDTPHVLYLSILVPAAEVARMVHADRTSPCIFLDERTIDKRLGGTLGQSPIATTYLNTGKAQLASHALRHEVASSIDNEVPVVGHTLADRYILYATARSDAVIRGIVGTLRRTIDVDNLYMVAIDTVHLLTATRGEADGQVIEGIEQQTGHRRRVATTRTLMVDEELTDSSEVFTNLCRHDVERTTQRQHGVHILNMGIEGEGAVAADAVGSGEVLHVDDHGNEVAQACLVEHGSLGLSC